MRKEVARRRSQGKFNTAGGKRAGMEIPKSVRQIGPVNGNRRIYIEDYVWTFGRQIAKQAGEKEVAGVLLGKISARKGEKYFFVSGMVEIKDFRYREEGKFTEEMWAALYTEIKEHFTDLEILGWFYAKAEMPPVCTEQLRGIHGKNFAGNDKLLYLYEAGEDEDALYLSSAGTLEKQGGYYIYYEKNPEMQEYMISHKKPSKIDERLNERAVGSMREILEHKQEEKEEKQERRSYGLAAALVLLLFLCGYMALKNQNTLAKVEGQMLALKETMGLTEGDDKEKGKQETTVETLAGNVMAATPPAVTVSPAAVTTPPEAVATPIVIAKKYDVYVVKKGDTLSKIAGQYYSDVTKAEKIRKYNKMKKEEVILVGQKLKLPLN